MRWVPARVKGSTDDPGCPSLRQGLPGVGRTAALCFISSAAQHEAGGNSSFCSPGTFQEGWEGAGSSQPSGASMTLLSWTLRLRELLCPLDCGPGTGRGLLSPSVSPARPKLASPACVRVEEPQLYLRKALLYSASPILSGKEKWDFDKLPLSQPG